MFKLAFGFLLAATITAFWGFMGIANADISDVAKVFFVLFMVLFCVVLIAGLLRRP